MNFSFGRLKLQNILRNLLSHAAKFEMFTHILEVRELKICVSVNDWRMTTLQSQYQRNVAEYSLLCTLATLLVLLSVLKSGVPGEFSSAEKKK